MVRGRGVIVLVVVAGLLLVGAGVFGLAVLDRPQVQPVDNDWGTVTPERTEVVTDIMVANPFLLRLGDGVADVRYNVRMNGVQVASGVKRGVRLGGPNETITVQTWLNNDRIPPWWVRHINRNETTTVRVNPEVELDYVGVDFPAEEQTRTRTFRTNLLGPLNTDRNRSVGAFGQAALTVDETSARWGEATREQTPIRGSATVTNELPVAVPVTDVRYTVQMNGVVVGRGSAGRDAVIPAGGTERLELRARIDNSKLDQWWVTHRRRNGTSRLSVDVNGTVRYAGVERRITLQNAGGNRTFRTDIFENGANESRTPSSLALPTSPSQGSLNRP